MKKFLFYLGVIPLFGVPLACNEAKFNSGAAETNKTSENEPKFSCSVKPESVELGNAVEIAVTSTAPYAEKLYERVKFGDTATNLELIPKEGGFQLKDGPNTFKADKVGNYAVEIRRSADGAVEATCSFAVAPLACSDQQRLIGANVAFIIDNSYSHSETDCQDIDRNIWNSERRVYCQKPTNRENAVLSAFDVLDAMARENNYNELAMSSLAIASFPTRDNAVDSSKIHTDGWIGAKSEVRSGIQSSLLFSREPTGYTPYVSGMRAAQILFGSHHNLNAQKAKIAVLVTDGEPTDRNPRETIRIAEKLRSEGVEIVTVFVTQGQTRAQRRSNHITFLRDEDQKWFKATGGRDNWYDRQVWSSFDPYVGELMGTGGNPQLVDKITTLQDPNCKDTDASVCARKIIEVSNSAELDKVFRQIVKNSTRCE